MTVSQKRPTMTPSYRTSRPHTANGDRDTFIEHISRDHGRSMPCPRLQTQRNPCESDSEEPPVKRRCSSVSIFHHYSRGTEQANPARDPSMSVLEGRKNERGTGRTAGSERRATAGPSSAMRARLSTGSHRESRRPPGRIALSCVQRVSDVVSVRQRGCLRGLGPLGVSEAW